MVTDFYLEDSPILVELSLEGNNNLKLTKNKIGCLIPRHPILFLVNFSKL